MVVSQLLQSFQYIIDKNKSFVLNDIRIINYSKGTTLCKSFCSILIAIEVITSQGKEHRTS